MLLSRLAEEFYSHILAERGGSENTVIAYRATVNQLLEFLEDEGISPELDQVTTALLRKFVVHIKGTGIRNSTVARHIHGLKSFWRFIVETYDLQSNLTLALRTPRVEHRIPDILSQDECERLLEACGQSHFALHRVRDRGIVKLMMILGLRRGEVIKLRVTDYDRERMALKVVDSKNRKSRVLPLPRGVASELDAWLDMRPQCKHEHLFTSREGGKLNPRAIYRMMDRLSQKAGLGGKHLRPHMLRHTAATMALRSSRDLLATQHLLGHSDPSITRIYCHLTDDDVRRTVASNPLSWTGLGHDEAKREANGNGLVLSSEEKDWIRRTDRRLQRQIDEYDQVLDGSDSLRKRWERYWIADWCRHAFAEDWPMSLREAEDVLWEDGVADGHSMAEHVRMLNLKRALEERSSTAQVPTSVRDWLVRLQEDLAVGLHGTGDEEWLAPDDTGAQGSHAELASLSLDAPGDFTTLARAVLVYLRVASALPHGRFAALAGELLMTITVSGRRWLPVYSTAWERPAWRGATQLAIEGHPAGLLSLIVGNLGRGLETLGMLAADTDA
jgi:integrase/recombinase XerD